MMTQRRGKLTDAETGPRFSPQFESSLIRVAPAPHGKQRTCSPAPGPAASQHSHRSWACPFPKQPATSERLARGYRCWPPPPLKILRKGYSGFRGAGRAAEPFAAAAPWLGAPSAHPAAAKPASCQCYQQGQGKKAHFLDRRRDHSCDTGRSKWEEEGTIEIEQGVRRTCKKSAGPKQEGKSFRTGRMRGVEGDESTWWGSKGRGGQQASHVPQAGRERMD